MSPFRNGSDCLFAFVDKMASTEGGLSWAAGAGGANGKNGANITKANLYKLGIRAGLKHLTN